MAIHHEKEKKKGHAEKPKPGMKHDKMADSEKVAHKDKKK